MADYRQIHTCIWKDSWFLELPSDYKLLFIYLFSNERACLAGLYDLSIKVIAFETELERDTIETGLEQFAQARVPEVVVQGVLELGGRVLLVEKPSGRPDRVP